MASLSEQVKELRDLLASHGIVMPGERNQPEMRTDYIAFGSDEHRQFLGLVVVDDGDDPTGYTTYKSQSSGITYRLEDEIGAVYHYPGMDPEKAALIVLRQKINELEGGVPEPPANAPSLWQPVDQYTTLVSARGG